MRLVENYITHKIHAQNPIPIAMKSTFKLTIYLFFCGRSSYCYGYRFYEGSGDTVTCKTCKKLMQKYIIKKLKGL